MNTYQTVQGDMWDSIAKRAYGTETAMDQLMRANPDLLQVAVFGAGEIVLLPQISAQEAASTAVPPWRKWQGGEGLQGRRTKVQVSLNGVDITSDLTGDTLSLTYTDSAEENADNVDFQIQNRDKKWLKGWFPSKMDTFSAQIIADGGTLDCGVFLLDDVGMSGRPLTVSIKGVAKPSDQDFSEVEHNQTWEQATLKDIASTIAGRAGIALEYDAQSNPTIQFQTQEGQTDQNFLQQLAEKHGITMKLYNQKLVLYEMKTLEQAGTVRTLRESDLLSWEAKTTLLDTSYSGVSVQYINTDGETMTYTYTGSGDKAPKVYKLDDQVDSLAMAQQVSEAKYLELNRGETTFSCSVPGDPALVSGICVELDSEDFGKFGGKYLIDSSTHTVSSGYTTDLEMHRVEG